MQSALTSRTSLRSTQAYCRCPSATSHENSHMGTPHKHLMHKHFTQLQNNMGKSTTRMLPPQQTHHYERIHKIYRHRETLHICPLHQTAARPQAQDQSRSGDNSRGNDNGAARSNKHAQRGHLHHSAHSGTAAGTGRRSIMRQEHTPTHLHAQWANAHPGSCHLRSRMLSSPAQHHGGRSVGSKPRRHAHRPQRWHTSGVSREC